MKGIAVLYEDDDILVLDKPSGLAVQGGAGVRASLDVLLAGERNPPPLLIHRLDKDTSGVIVTAKTPEAARNYSALIRSGLKKRYMALCSGSAPQNGIILDELEIRGKKKQAETRYRRLALGRLEGKSVSLLELSLGTGRMHQIRRHLAGMGFPVLGDDKYGDFALNKDLKKRFGLKKLLLHASSVTLEHAGTIRAPLPEHFLRFLDQAGCEMP